MVFGVILLILILVFIIVPIAIYNNLVALKNRLENAWRQIDVQLKRRADLHPKSG